jgi:cytochrome c oxidase subunit III
MSAPNVRTYDSPARTGVLIGIAAISMCFAALTSSLVIRQGGASDWLHFRLPPILFVNTLVLMVSSGTLVLSRRRLDQDGASQAGRSLLYATLALGVLFVVGQFVAWRELVAQGLYIATSPSSSFFYLFTVFHAVHVLGGLGGLGYVVVRLNRHDGRSPLSALAAAALYWHFMLVLWLYLLLILWMRV